MAGGEMKSEDTVSLHAPPNDGLSVKCATDPALLMRTAVTFFRYFAHGTAGAILGPTLVSIAFLHQTDTAVMSWAFTSMNLGGVVGAILCAVTMDRINPELFMSAACLWHVVGMATAPFTGHVIGFILLMGLMGAGMGFIGSCIPAYMMRIWEGSEYKSVIMHSLNVFYSVGQFITPLIIRQFIMDSKALRDTEQLPNCLNHSISDGENATLSIHEYSVGDNLHGDHFNTTDIIPSDAYYVRNGYVAVSALPMMSLALSVITFVILGNFNKTMQLDKHVKSDIRDTKQVVSGCRYTILIVVYSLFSLLFDLVLSSSSGFFAALTVQGLCKDVKTGSDITMVYFIANSAGKLLTIPVSKYIRPSSMLYILFSLSIAAWSCGMLLPVFPQLVWVTVVLAGLGISSMHFSSLMWLSDYTPITATVTALCMASGFAGGVIFPPMIGYLFNTYSYMWAVYIPFMAVIVKIILFVVMKLLVTC